ncbi:hypothetical protein IP81_00030 [Novosphingobium sp. AAP83]|nr:hypothetical protein IP81_00030 [Novosphingobium sp. AAP83]
MEALLRCNMSLLATSAAKFREANISTGQKAYAPSAPATLDAARSVSVFYPGTKRVFLQFPDACPGLIMLHGNMESTSFLEGLIRNYGTLQSKAASRILAKAVVSR